MGWGRTLLLGDIGNHMDIEDVQANVGHLRGRIDAMRSRNQQRSTDQDAALAEAHRRIEELEGEVDDMMLYITGLAELLVTDAGVPRAKLQQLVGAVDREDGPPQA
ncbi:hypothetical protein [Ruania zhangjianzhongii]|uniref:hypothetical protein n=1 Tax=Ruania zhangjianzhongii TaxID=2603206 RepID=UPI0011CAF6FB|nr:hypothetical protein [Ruania zhangjianzhongii]